MTLFSYGYNSFKYLYGIINETSFTSCHILKWNSDMYFNSFSLEPT